MLAVVAALALVLPPLSLAAGESHMLVVRSKHYEVKTDISQRIADLVSQHMEAMYQEYMRRFSDYDLKTPEPFNVVVFAKKEDYNAAVPPQMSGSMGAFIAGQRLLSAWKGDRSEEDLFRTLYHEGFHQFLFSTISNPVPIWVNEGFAEYFAEATWGGRGFTTGRVPYLRLFVLQKALAKGQHIPLAELFAMTDTTWMGNVGVDQDKVNIQYCEAWSVVHFLIHADGGRYRPRILAYLKRVGEGANNEETFRASFGSDIKAFERAWAGYVKDLKPTSDEICRKNLEIILFLATSYYKNLAEFTSVEKFGREVMNPTRVASWEVTTADGEKISSLDRDRVRSLFACPFDSRRKGVSYVLIKDPQTDLPMVFCGHHPGIVYKAYCVPKVPEGGYRVYVEQVVRETLPENLVRLLQAQGK